MIAPNNRYSINAGYNHIFSPTFDMSVNFGINRHVEQSTTQSFGFASSTLGLPNFIDSIAPSFPEIQPQSYSPLGAQAGLDNYIVPQTLWTSSVDFTKSMGRHNIGFGFMDVWARIDGGHYANTTLAISNDFDGGTQSARPSHWNRQWFRIVLVGRRKWNGSDGLHAIPGDRQASCSAGMCRTPGKSSHA